MSDTTKKPRPGRGGTIPPVDKRFQPGMSGNPAGRPAAGASVKEWANSLCAQRVSIDQLRKIAADKKCEYAKSLAAKRMLRSLEHPDMADFEPYLEGRESIEQLRSRGVDTTLIKKSKITVTETETGTITRREIELHDRSLPEAEFVCEQTDGRPPQSVQVQANNQLELRTRESREEAAAMLLDRAKYLMKNPGG